MERKLYFRGMLGQAWYNSSEALAYALLYRPTPKELVYKPKVSYGPERMNYINIYYPKESENKKKPLFIYIHGGGWVSGITDMRNNYISNWAKLGFFTASVSYSYAPQKVFPFQLKEIIAAIDFLFDKADEYSVDTDNIVIAGESAGGYYISYLAAIAADNSLLDKLGIEFRHKDEFSIKAMVSHSGCFDIERLTDTNKPQSRFPDIKMMLSSFFGKSHKELVSWLKTEDGKLASPPVTKGYPPVFVAWCAKDYLRYESFDLLKQLDELGIENEQFKGDGIISMHAWTIVTVFKKGKDCFKKASDFVTRYLPEYF